MIPEPLTSGASPAPIRDPDDEAREAQAIADRIISGKLEHRPVDDLGFPIPAHEVEQGERIAEQIHREGQI